MGLPAARTPDLTSHIALTGVVAAAIDASSLPGPAMVAAYIGAMLLQIPTGAIIPPCVPNVLVGFLPAARVLDLHACVPHLSSNTIIKGAETVLITGLPAARLTSKCFCAAEVTTGWPTVLIGGPTVTIPVNIKGDADFTKKTQKMMAELYGTPTGKKMFKGIADSGNTVTVVPTTDANGYCQAENGPNSHDPTKGSNSTVSWNPNHTGDPPSTATIIGGHEFVHAYHNATGTAKDGPYDSYPGQSGFRTVARSVRPSAPAARRSSRLTAPRRRSRTTATIRRQRIHCVTISACLGVRPIIHPTGRAGRPGDAARRGG